MTDSRPTITIEWYDEVTGEWRDLGEARDKAAAEARIAGLRAADDEPQLYRIHESRYSWTTV